MTGLAHEMFKLVSLRAPLSGFSIDPSRYVNKSQVMLLLKDIRIDTVSQPSPILAQLDRLHTLTRAEINSMILEKVAKSLEGQEGWTLQKLFQINIHLENESYLFIDITNLPQFEGEYRKVFDSWLILRLKKGDNELIVPHERILRAGYLLWQLTQNPESLNEQGQIAKVLEAYCKLPSEWRALIYRGHDLRVRHTETLQKMQQVASSELHENIDKKKKLWQEKVRTVHELEVIRSAAHKEYHHTKQEATGLGQKQNRLAKRKLNSVYFDGLKNRLNDGQKSILNNAIAYRLGGSALDIDDLIGDLDTMVPIAEANELCHEISVLEEMEQNELPVTSLDTKTILKPFVRGIGWGELVVARERLVGYATREIAHIENVLPGEVKIRKHERTSSTEEVVETETVTEKETEKDSQTTDRFELQNQSETAIQQNFSVQAGLNTSGRYGLTKVETNLNTGLQLSKSEAQSSAQNLAKEIVSKAVERTFESVRKLRRLTITEKIQELNSHKLKNVPLADATNQPTSISGIYMWLEKIHKVELRHYGRRLMLEFHIPEPAISILEQTSKQKKRRLPPFELGPLDINVGNYLCLAQKYQGLDIQAPPAQYINVGYTWGSTPGEEEENKAEDTVSATISIPDGYIPKEGIAMVSGIKASYDLDIHLTVGGIDVITKDDAKSGDKRASFEFDPVLSWPGGVPVSMRGKYHFDKTLVIQVVLTCERANEAIIKWQIDTWEKLRTGYEVILRRLDGENQAEAQLKTMFATFTGRPESENRLVERQEIQKWAIKAMRSQSSNFNAIELIGNMQEISPINSDMQAPIVKFFEEAFEWDQMSYFLYPYFWARRESWKMRYNISSTDKRHEAFLKAGAARVIVPVTPGYESKVLYYVEADPTTEELDRIEGSRSDEIPEGTSFEDLWLELLIDRKADVALGTGTLKVTNGSDRVMINQNSNWNITDRDIGRELYIGSEMYTLKEKLGDKEFRLDKPFKDPTDLDARYGTGSVPYGQPWVVNVPTSLVILDDNTAKLKDLT